MPVPIPERGQPLGIRPGVSPPRTGIEFLQRKTIWECFLIKPMTRLRPWAGIVSLLLVLSLAACSMPFGMKASKDGTAKKIEVAPPIIPVEAQAAELGSISEYFQTYAQVQAETKVDLIAQGVGECLEVMVDEGDTVTRGQILAELDKEEARASLSQAQVQVKQNEGDYLRAEDGLKGGIIAQADRDATYFAYQQSKENLRSQQVQLENLTVRAPFDGVVTVRHIQQGMLVNSGMACFSLVDPNTFMVPVDVPENLLPRLSEGQQALVTIDSLDGQEFRAHIRRINPGIGTAGTVKVLLDFEDDAQGLLRDMAFARVRLVMETHGDALLVPKDAVLEENGRKYIFVVRRSELDEAGAGDEAGPEETVDEGESDSNEVLASSRDSEDESEGPPLEAERVEVEVGLDDSDFAEILSGLNLNDLLVTNGQHTLQDGTRLRVTNTTDEILSKAGLTPEAALAAAKKNQDESKEGGRRGGGMRVRMRH